MSIDAMSWAFRQNLPPAEKLVLLSLADHHNAGTGLCIPSQRSIAEQTSMSVRTVQRHLSSLEQRGLIVRSARFRSEGRGRTSDGYLLQSDSLARWSVQGDTGRTTNTTNQDDQGDKGVRALTGREPEENPLAAAPRERTRDVLFETVAEVCGHRLDRLTRTERGKVNRAVKDLKDVGAEPEAVRQAARRWATIYPQATLTPTALASHWSRLQPVARLPECRTCGVRGEHDQGVCDAFAAGRY